MRNRCTFTYQGRPVTKPGTPADTKRIALSRWITDMLVHNGEEQAGDYLIPGESGYTPDQMSAAATHYSHLDEKPQVSEAELKSKALSLLRDGYRQDEIAGKIGVSYATLVDWRKNSQYAERWDAAYAVGKFKRRNSNPVRDSKTAQRVEPAVAPPPARPAPAVVAPTPTPPQTTIPRKNMAKSITVREEKQLQETILQRLAIGELPDDLKKEFKRFNNTRLADWRKNPRFVMQYDEAKRTGKEYLKNGGKAPQPIPTPLFERGVDRVVDGVTFAQPDKSIIPRLTPADEQQIQEHREFVEKQFKPSPFEAGNDIEAPMLTETDGPKPGFRTFNWDGPSTPVSVNPKLAQRLSFTIMPGIAPAPDEQVNGPSHYNGRETYDQMLALFGKEQVLAFCRITAYKYQSRAGKKAGNSWEQDMEKMKWYLQRITELTA